MLTIDIGNSLTKFFLKNGESIKVDNSTINTTNDVENIISKFTFDKVIISSVEPSLSLIYKDYFRNKKVPFLFLEKGVKSGIKLNVKNPNEVGTDLIALAAFSSAVNDKPKVIISFGTATTISFVKDKVLEGVIIAPNLFDSLNNLFNKAAKIPVVELSKTELPFGRTTDDAISVGFRNTVKGLINETIKGVQSEYNLLDYEIIVTGGRAPSIIDLIDIKYDLYEEFAVNKGLLIIGEKNEF